MTSAVRTEVVLGLIVPAFLIGGTAAAQPPDWADSTPIADGIAISNGTGLVEFDGSLSYSPESGLLDHVWDFGDGSTSSSTFPNHTYASGTDTVTVTLTVTDAKGAIATDRVEVAPFESSPQITVSGMDRDNSLAVGEAINLDAVATDAEDGPLPVRWSVTHISCADTGGCSREPQPEVSGDAVRHRFPDRNRTEVHYVARTTDSRGTDAVNRFVVRPRYGSVDVDSSNSADVWVGQPGRQSHDATVGTQVQVNAAATATDGVFRFYSWSVNGQRDRRIGVTVTDNPITVTATYLSPIEIRYRDEPALAELLGAPNGAEQQDGAIRYQVYSGGRLYWSAAEGAHQISGAILAEYLRAGGHRALGVPATDETSAADGQGRFNHLAGTDGLPASIYFSPATGAHTVRGAIRARYAELGFEQGIGYPTASEQGTPDGIGRFTHFRASDGVVGSIYWTPRTGAQDIKGAVRATWARLGYETGPLGYPTTGELGTPDGLGRFNHFVGTAGNPASIYWTPASGSHEVLGAIRARWAQLGWERSYLGYPRSGEYAVPNGRRSDFLQGYIVFDYTTGIRDARH